MDGPPISIAVAPRGARSLDARCAIAAGVVSRLFVAGAQAVPLTGSPNPLAGSNFQGGDGDQVVDAPLTDWQTPRGIATIFPDPNPDDDLRRRRSKEHDAGDWDFATQDGGSTPARTTSSTPTRGRPRSPATCSSTWRSRAAPTRARRSWRSSSTSAPTCGTTAGATIPCRTTGDIIVSSRSSGNNPDVILQQWTSVDQRRRDRLRQDGHADRLHDVHRQRRRPGRASTPGRSRTSCRPASRGRATRSPRSQFGEGSLNLTTLLEGALGSPCFSFGSIWMHTRASTSDTSNLDDYIAPQPLLVAQLLGARHEVPRPRTPTASRTPASPASRASASGPTTTTTASATRVSRSTTPTPTGSYTITNIQDPGGTYSLREQLTAGAAARAAGPAPSRRRPAPAGTSRARTPASTATTTPNSTGKDFGNYKQATVISREADRAERRGRSRSRSRRRSPARRPSASPTTASESTSVEAGRVHGDRDRVTPTST